MSIESIWGLQEAAKKGHAKEVHRLIALSTRTEDRTYALYLAALNGHVDCIELLLPVCNTHLNEYFKAVKAAAGEGHLDCLKLLTTQKQWDHISVLERALRGAARNGRSQCVGFIVSAHPNVDGTGALENAALMGHVECIKLLLPISEPKTNLSLALQNATLQNHLACIDLLFDVSEAQVALDAIQNKHPEIFLNDDAAANSGLWHLKHKVDAQRQQDLLMRHLPKAIPPAKNARKM